MRDPMAWHDVLCCGGDGGRIVPPKYVHVDHDEKSDSDDDSSTFSTASTTIDTPFSALETIWEVATATEESDDDIEEFFRKPVPFQRSNRKTLYL